MVPPKTCRSGHTGAPASQLIIDLTLPSNEHLPEKNISFICSIYTVYMFYRCLDDSCTDVFSKGENASAWVLAKQALNRCASAWSRSPTWQNTRIDTVQSNLNELSKLSASAGCPASDCSATRVEALQETVAWRNTSGTPCMA